ncbi:MAG: NAD(P)-dependent oxidoreductase [Geobacteraceae bacterium GWC2_58_44]|nr:MAG: NAD(P)-dependent oxidoreductase [Geobacteraceae bacterium GWC2_58_44]HBG06067.1 NAD(P)-dependent oxidoreductase [Geobacter sp.]
MKRLKILILGATGMLGHTLLNRLSQRGTLEVHGTARSREGLASWFAPQLQERIHSGVDADNFDSILRVLGEVRPDVVVNCIGIIKQLPIAKDPVVSIGINALFPHRLALACKAAGARLIHISTDCVFKGDKGNYSESDQSDAEDLYGRSKFLGEVAEPHCVTLRTSIIGHELKGGYGLIDWFLAQQGTVKGFTKAIYTGFPTAEMVRIIADYVIPNADLHGLYQVASAPITKYDLLNLVAERYGKRIGIEPQSEFCCDRSLDGSRFRAATGYSAPGWQEMVDAMWQEYRESHEPRQHP